ncbi:GDSL-type esterase/lipase family protein [Spirosoma profusum]|uniref:GDSL-type esterase/lipase family protein n=1 Tax=Spirosoma profusum TaxID=2771354 RepID=UPI00293C0724|nr:GDSL-type esterase/lipase family protein [Spirosoma profusum]
MRYALIGLLTVGLQSFISAQTIPPGCAPGCVLITIKRLPKGTIPPPQPQGLPTPSFSPQNGVVPYGNKVNVTAASLPTGAIVEYSTNNGQSWITGNQTTSILNSTDILARTRLNQQVSPTIRGNFKPSFQRMMVIGNSIMAHGPAPEVGWNLFNGMAASAPEKDFVHLLEAHLKTLNPEAKTELQTGGDFERSFGTDGYTINQFNKPVQEFQPDLIIVRIGENIDDGQVNGSRDLEANFSQLLDRLASLNPSQPVKIICTTTVWDRPNTDAIIRKVTNAKGYPLVDLRSMVGQSQYFASEYKDPNVAAHPNDAGMKRIADLIIEKLQ